MRARGRFFKSLRLAVVLFIALACLISACAPALSAAMPTATALSPTFAAAATLAATATVAAATVPAATATTATTATPAATAMAAATAMPAATATTTAQNLEPALDAFMQQLARTGQFSGSVLVAQNGQVILSKGYGLADQAKNLPNTPQTKYRIYSVTKQFTAMAIMLLQQQGKLKVQDKICQYLAACPAAWQPVTIHELLTHTSGIPDTQDIHAGGDLTSTLPLEQMITDAKALPLDFPPGSKSSYDNLGYILLGKIIEAASGQTYAAFLQQNIFGPLGMAHTDYDDNRPDVAMGYSDPRVPAGPVNLWVPFSADGLDSTVEDLYRWDQALYTDKLVPPAARDAIFTAYLAADVPGFGVGYGWLIGSNNGRRVYFHPGGSVGFASIIMRYPDDKATIILLSNLETTDTFDTADTLAQKLFAK